MVFYAPMCTRRFALTVISIFALSCAEATTLSPDAQGLGPDSGGTLDDSGVLLDAQTHDCTSALTGWHALGGPLESSPSAGTQASPPSIAIDSSTGAIYVGWAEGAPADAHVRTWDGDAWQSVGAPLSMNPDNSSVYTVHLAARDGQLIMAHTESGGETSSGFYAHRWQAGDWELMGGGDLSTANVNTSGGAVALDDDGHPVVAWSQYTPGQIGRNRIHVRRFTELAYVPLDPELGGIAGPGASALTPSLAFDSAGDEIVAFSESGVRTFRRGDSAWESYGGEQVVGIPDILGAHSPHLARTPGGDPVIAIAQYDSTTSTSNGYLLEWTGSAWQSVGSALDIVPGEHSYMRDLVIDANGAPVIALSEGPDDVTSLYIMRWNGSGFVDVGTLPLSAYTGTQSVIGAALDVDVCGRLMVAFTEADTGGDRAVHVYRFYQ